MVPLRSPQPIPKPGPDDVIVKTTKALICTSDSHTVHGAIGPRENLTLGHEAVGIVHEVGSNVKLFKPGDRVLFNPEDQLEVEIQGEGHLVMRERDIHAVATERTEHGTGLYL